jgi:hypothetical protein
MSLKYDNIVTTMLGLLAREDAPDKIEALICTGLSKLVLSRMITDDRVSTLCTIICQAS